MMIPAYTIPEQPDRLILIRYNHIQSPRSEEVSHSNCPAIQNQCTTNRGSHFTESAGAIIQPELIFLITGKSPAVHCGPANCVLNDCSGLPHYHGVIIPIISLRFIGYISICHIEIQVPVVIKIYKLPCVSPCPDLNTRTSGHIPVSYTA